MQNTKQMAVHGSGRSGGLGGAAQLVAATAYGHYREWLAVVAVVVVAGRLPAISTFASAGMRQQSLAHSRIDSSSSLCSASAFGPLPVAVKTLTGVVVAAGNVGAAVNAEAGHLCLRLLLAARRLEVRQKPLYRIDTRVQRISALDLCDRVKRHIAGPRRFLNLRRGACVKVRQKRIED